MNSSHHLKSVRENLGLNQAQMAGLLGINRSYLAELESERRPVMDWVVKKADEVQRRMRGVTLINPSPDPVDFGRSFDELKAEIIALSNDELLELAEHLTETSHDAPRAAMSFYKIAIKIAMSEVTARLRIKIPRLKHGGVIATIKLDPLPKDPAPPARSGANPKPVGTPRRPRVPSKSGS